MSEACGEVLDEVRRAIRSLLGPIAATNGSEAHLLDVGCWDGIETTRYAQLLHARAHGIEIFPEPAVEAERNGVDVARVDLESGRFPWADGSMDVVIANQVFEHLKNIWLPMSEMFRVTRDGGWLVISVPNLGSLHNRALMLFGAQPTSIRTFGPHVRGYTAGEFARFVTFEGAYELVNRTGVGFYPLPAHLATPLARAWPSASHTTVLLARKRAGVERAPWQAFVEDGHEGLQTFYGEGATSAR